MSRMPLTIEVSRPLSFLLVVGLTVFGLSYIMSSGQQQADLITAQGGETPPQLAIQTAEDEVRRQKLESELADRQITVLKYQLNRLEQERGIMGDDLTEQQQEQFRAGLRLLVDLIEGKKRADEKMVASFHEMWDARRAGMAAAVLSEDNPVIVLDWPVEPMYGISAIFNDPEYEKIFGLTHEGIDIPTIQETTIRAPADGIVEEVVDHGLGYSYLTIRHAGYVTLYGHVSAFLVSKGQHVTRGEPIAKSGGMPGTKGAGHLTTGPHLHFELITGKGHINPLKYLPASGAELRQGMDRG